MKNYTINEITDTMKTYGITEIKKLIEEYRDADLPYWNMPFHYEAEGWATLKYFTEWIEKLSPDLSTSVKSTEDSAVIETQSKEAVEDPMTFSFEPVSGVMPTDTEYFPITDTPISKEETTGEELDNAYKVLERHNNWRRGGSGVAESPTVLGQSIDDILNYRNQAQSEISQLRESNRELVEFVKRIAENDKNGWEIVEAKHLLSKHNNK